MRTTPQIRAASGDDLAGVRHVAMETWPATYRGFIPEADIEAFLESNYSTGALERTRATVGDGLIVAALDATIVGYAMVSEDRDGHAQLWTIYVLPDHQGKGIGTRLWDAAIERARDVGLTELVLWVLSDNATACRFYESRGAVEMGRRDFEVGAETIQETGYRIDIAPA